MPAYREELDRLASGSAAGASADVKETPATMRDQGDEDDDDDVDADVAAEARATKRENQARRWCLCGGSRASAWVRDVCVRAGQ